MSDRSISSVFGSIPPKAVGFVFGAFSAIAATAVATYLFRRKRNHDDDDDNSDSDSEDEGKFPIIYIEMYYDHCKQVSLSCVFHRETLLHDIDRDFMYLFVLTRSYPPLNLYL